MDWQEARESTIELWQGIAKAVDRQDPVELLTEINAVCDLCFAAHEQAPAALDRCRHCLAFQQFGGCREVNGLMSEKVVEKDWDGLRELIDQFISLLEGLETPAAVPETS